MPDEAPFATIREMYAVKDALLGELHAMELRLMTAIADANRAHDATHTDMRRRADDRHKALDEALKAEERQDAVAAAEIAGRSAAFRSIIAGLRIANEFRWLIAITIVGLILLTNGFHLSVNAS